MAIDRYVVFGQVVGVHIDERFIRDGLLDTAAMRPIARAGHREPDAFAWGACFVTMDTVMKLYYHAASTTSSGRRGADSCAVPH